MITYSLLTNKGDHEPNEDTIAMTEAEGSYCFVLADGLGGHGKGEVASNLVTTEAVQLFHERRTEEDYIAEAFMNSQQELLARQREDRAIHGMKTTMVLLTIGEQEIRWGHIGDSRLYYFRKNKLVKRTLDHSVPQMLVASHQMKEKDIRNHPDRNRLLRVMGSEWTEPKYELNPPVRREAGKRQAFLMCSDGFWELIDEKNMMRLLKEADTVEQWLQAMEAVVLQNGAEIEMDNYSAIGVWIE